MRCNTTVCLQSFIRDFPLVRRGSPRTRRAACPGGVGNFGFNTYNLMAFMLMSFNHVSNILVNTNNNQNNNNNNDFQASFGSINTNQQTSEATQTGSTMTMITVPPVETNKYENNFVLQRKKFCSQVDKHFNLQL